jgi:hypothetical protein
MRLEDALFNWLQIRIVADARPEDGAARSTLEFFEEILREDHGLTDVAVAAVDAATIQVRYIQEGRSELQLFDREAGEQLLLDIEANPKYNGT